MAGTTGIEWCDATFNPWWGCEKVSPACAHCYADTLSKRYAAGKQLWGGGHDFRFFGDKHWDEPLKWARLLPAKLGRRPRVFCASMADVFEEHAELHEHRVRLFDLILRTPELDWLILTKRPEFARDWLAGGESRRHVASAYARHFEDGDNAWDFAQQELARPLRNVWMGVSIENARYTWRADVLREIPAAVRFISAEPLLGSLFYDGRSDEALGLVRQRDDSLGAREPRGASEGVARSRAEGARSRAQLDLSGIDWLIAGGESGPKARPSHPDWFRELRDACLGRARVVSATNATPSGEWTQPQVSRGTAFFFKQWGEWAPGLHGTAFDAVVQAHRAGRDRPHLVARAGGQIVGKAMLGTRDHVIWRVGKKAAGRELDGRVWDEFPAGVKSDRFTQLDVKGAS